MIITRAPLRISFFGGGTDFPEYFARESGAVLATAIDKYSYVTASHFHSRLFNYSVRVSYTKGESVKTVQELEHPVFRACLELCGLTKDIELHTVADLPSFTGLGSSSSFTVALLLALHSWQGRYVSPVELAYKAIHVERNLLKENVGVQDQATAAIGGFNVLEFYAEDDIRVRPLNLTRARLHELESYLLLVFTSVTRRATEIEGRKLKSYVDRTAVLKEMRSMVDTGYDALVGGGSLERFGRLLDRAWQAKRSFGDFMTNDRIEGMYQAGLEAGAWGGKLLGAGGGGFLLFCAPPERHPEIVSRFPHDATVAVKLNADSARVIYDRE
jgi:D-glycero-alpha-D-manno-heptose-7-phosphate kinase